MLKILTRVYYTFAWIAIIFTIVVMATGTWWMIAPHSGMISQTDPPLVVHAETVEVSNVLTYTVSYCVDDSLPLPAMVDRTLEFQPVNLEQDPVAWPVAPTISYMITERCETKTRLLGIPAFIVPGKYHIHAYSSLQVNPLRTIKQEWKSNDFTVIPSSKQAQLRRDAEKAADTVEHDAVIAAEKVLDIARKAAGAKK